MTTEEDFMRGLVRIKVDIPGLKADLKTARAEIERELGAAGKLRISAAGSGPAGSTRPTPGGSSGPTSYGNAALARSMRKASIIEERARTKELGRPVTKEMRLDARRFRKELKSILDDPRLTDKEIEIELKVLDKVFKRDFASSVSFIQKQEREAATRAKQAAKQAKAEALSDQKEADKASAAARKEMQAREQRQLKEHEDRKAAIIKERRSRNAPVRKAYQSSVTRTGESALLMGEGLEPSQQAAIKDVHFRNREKIAAIRRDPKLRTEAKEREIKVESARALEKMRALRKEFVSAKALMEKPIMLKVQRDKTVDGIRRDALRLRGAGGAGSDAALNASATRAIRAVRALSVASASLPKSKRIKLQVDADKALRDFRKVRDTVERPIVGRVVTRPGMGSNLTRLFGGGAFVGGGGGGGSGFAGDLGGAFGGGGGRLLGRVGSAAAASGPMGVVAAGAAGGALAGGAAASAYAAVTKQIATDGLARLALVEKYKASLGIILKDQKAANDLFTELEDLDIKLPVGLDVLAESAQKLAGSGTDPAKISAYVEAIANAGSLSVDGLNEGVSRITRAITQIQSKGKLEMEDLNQIAELGIPIRQIIKDQFGMTADELRDAIKDGTMTMAGAVEGIMDAFTTNYGGALAKQGETLLGQMDRLRDAYKKFAGEASEPLFDSLQFALENILSMLKDGGLDGVMKPFVDGINIAAGAVVVLSTNLETMVSILKSMPTGSKLVDALTVAGGLGEGLAERAKGKLEEERIKAQFAEAQKIIKEKERRDALTPEERAAEDEAKRQKELATQKNTDFTAAKKEYEERTGLTFDGKLGSKEGDALIKDFKTRQDFQGVLDRVNEANNTDFKYDDFTEDERNNMRGRDSKNKREEEKRKIIARRAAAAGMTVEEFESGMAKSQSGAILGGARGALGMVGRGLSAAGGLLGGAVPAIDAATGGAASAVGGAFTMSNEDLFNRAKEGIAAIKADMYDQVLMAPTTEEGKKFGGMFRTDKQLKADMDANAAAADAIWDTDMNLKGFVDKNGALKLDLDTKSLAKKDFSSQAVGFGDLNRAIQDKIDQAAQTKYAEETAKNTKEMKDKIAQFLDTLTGTNNTPKFNSPIGP